jgi:hypothetical protein
MNPNGSKSQGERQRDDCDSDYHRTQGIRRHTFSPSPELQNNTILTAKATGRKEERCRSGTAHHVTYF